LPYGSLPEAARDGNVFASGRFAELLLAQPSLDSAFELDNDAWLIQPRHELLDLLYRPLLIASFCERLKVIYWHDPS
jgi:hypothetical protein